MIGIYRSPGLGGQVLRFSWHFVQMVVAMYIGMFVYVFARGLLGQDDLPSRWPEVGAILMALSMVIPMAAWMKLGMGMGWYRAGEMSAAMILPILVLVVICSIGLAPHMVALAGSMPVMYVAMLGVMAYRWRVYSHRHQEARAQDVQSATTVPPKLRSTMR